MGYSRTALVAMLLAVELLLVGLMFATFRGFWGPSHEFARASAQGFDHMILSGKDYAPVAAGLTPHVQVDDPDSGVSITASNDGMVHVHDASSVQGFVWGGASKIPDVTVSRTADGVHISRASNLNGIFVLGEQRQHVDIAVPSGSHVDIGHCSSAQVSGMRNTVDVRSQDGHITLADIQGNVDAHSDDGRIEASDLTGTTLALSTNDGSLHLHNIHAASLDATTSDGSIEAKNLAIDGTSSHATLHTNDGSLRLSGNFAAQGSYDFSTGDGRVELALAPGSDLTVNASTGDGRIYVDGSPFGDGDSAAHTVHLGSGSGTMRLASQDGSIHITTNGAI